MRMGLPKILTTDQGREFLNQLDDKIIYIYIIINNNFSMIIITSDVTPEPSLDEVELYPELKRRKSLNETSLNPEGIQQCVEFVAYLGQ